MTTIAFLYPGQGSQRVAMGRGLRGADAERLEAHLEAAGRAASLDLRRLCAEGPLEALTRTEAAQPALLALSLTLTEIAGELGLRAAAVCGHSLGEYSAAVAAGALSGPDGIALVAARGALMARAQTERPGAMAAVLGLPPEAVARLCARAAHGRTLVPANVNAPEQVVVSGDAAAVDELVDRIARTGAQGVRAVRLPVGAAFHSPLMEPARARLATTMTGLAWRDPAVPLIANVSGAAVSTAGAVRDALTRQIVSPVQWVACVQALLATGCTTFVELGPGRVLTGLVNRIAPHALAVAADTRAKLEAVAQAGGSCA